MERVRKEKASRTFPRLKLLKEFTAAAIDVKGARDGIVLVERMGNRKLESRAV